MRLCKGYERCIRVMNIYKYICIYTYNIYSDILYMLAKIKFYSYMYIYIFVSGICTIMTERMLNSN